MSLMQRLMRHCFLVKILMKKRKRKMNDHGKDSHSYHTKPTLFLYVVAL